MQYIYQVKKREFISKRGKNRLYSLCTFNKWKSGWLLQDLPSGPQKLGLVHFRVVVHTVTAPWARSGKVIGWEVGSQTPNSLMSFDLFPNGNGKRGTLVIILGKTRGIFYQELATPSYTLQPSQLCPTYCTFYGPDGSLQVSTLRQFSSLIRIIQLWSSNL